MKKYVKNEVSKSNKFNQIGHDSQVNLLGLNLTLNLKDITHVTLFTKAKFPKVNSLYLLFNTVPTWIPEAGIRAPGTDAAFPAPGP